MGAGDEFREVVAGDVLHHAAAGFDDLAAPGDTAKAQEMIAQRARLDALRGSGNWRCATALEADVDTLGWLHAFGDLECLVGLPDVDANGFLAVHVLAGCNRGIQMLHVEERRRGDLDKIDVRRRGKLLESVRPVEGELAVDG